MPYLIKDSKLNPGSYDVVSKATGVAGNCGGAPAMTLTRGSADLVAHFLNNRKTAQRAVAGSTTPDVVRVGNTLVRHAAG